MILIMTNHHYLKMWCHSRIRRRWDVLRPRDLSMAETRQAALRHAATSWPHPWRGREEEQHERFTDSGDGTRRSRHTEEERRCARVGEEEADVRWNKLKPVKISGPTRATQRRSHGGWWVKKRPLENYNIVEMYLMSMNKRIEDANE
jgi:hypothetical protein